jgi:hypothetical protein
VGGQTRQYYGQKTGYRWDKEKNNQRKESPGLGKKTDRTLTEDDGRVQWVLREHKKSPS